jgi:PRTRC genetic system ThiF family protein
MITNKELARYFNENLHPITISLIGVGGTGSQVLSKLGAMHSTLKQLNKKGLEVRAFDFDTVSEPNIGRSHFNHAEVEGNKAIELINRINRFYNTKWKGFDTSKNNPTVTNILITCVDNVKTRKAIAKTIKNMRGGYDKGKMFLWIDCGNDLDYGQVITTSVLSKTSKNFFSYFPKAKDNPQTPSCSMQEALSKQDLYVNTFAADIAVNSLWHALNNKPVHNMTMFNLKKNQMKGIDLYE